MMVSSLHAPSGSGLMLRGHGIFLVLALRVRLNQLIAIRFNIDMLTARSLCLIPLIWIQHFRIVNVFAHQRFSQLLRILLCLLFGWRNLAFRGDERDVLGCSFRIHQRSLRVCCRFWIEL